MGASAAPASQLRMEILPSKTHEVTQSEAKVDSWATFMSAEPAFLTCCTSHCGVEVQECTGISHDDRVQQYSVGYMADTPQVGASIVVDPDEGPIFMIGLDVPLENESNTVNESPSFFGKHTKAV